VALLPRLPHRRLLLKPLVQQHHQVALRLQVELLLLVLLLLLPQLLLLLCLLNSQRASPAGLQL
jgi:hypothetical protein